MSINHKRELLQLILSIKDEKLMDEFLADILTIGEYRDVIKRLQIIKKLKQGLSQREIAKELGVSISKVTRGSLALQNKKGGFNKLVK